MTTALSRWWHLWRRNAAPAAGARYPIDGYLSSISQAPNVATWDESTLIQQARDGDSEAFGRLYTQYVNPIFRYVYYRVADSAEAEDLTAHVFLKAWQALPGYRQEGYPLSSWLYRIANNVVIDHHRRRKVFRFSSLEHEGPIADERLSPQERMIQAESHAALASAIKKLTDDQQQVIILRFIEGLSHAEVAHIIGKSENACRAVQFRALAALARELQPELQSR